MPYSTWTQKDLDLYRKYVSNIKFEQLGTVNIGGIFKKNNPSVEKSVSAFIFRLYDDNKFCPDRQAMSSDPKIGLSVKNGTVKGLVVMIAKDKNTGDFFNVNNSLIASPAAAWIAANYKGGAEAVGEQVMREHQGSLHSTCCTHGDRGEINPVLNSQHIKDYILPSITKSFAPEIKAVDLKTGHPMMSAGAEADEAVSAYTMSEADLQGLLGEEFSTEGATVTFVPEGGLEATTEQENITTEEQNSTFAEILGRLAKKDAPVAPETPVVPTGSIEQ